MPFQNEKNILFSKHHIGGRSGSTAFPTVKKLHKSMAITSYEADVNCLPQIEQMQRNMGYDKIEIIGKYIGSSDSSIKFNLNYDPYTSSVLQVNQKYLNFYNESGDFDYDFKSTMKTVKTIELPVVSLDSVEKLYPIDFLSLDAQGSELEILKGATNSLQNVVGIETEISFIEMYKDTPLFGDICSFLNKQGFDFICFTNVFGSAPLTMPYFGRARKNHSFGEAFFLKKPSLLKDDNQRKKLIFSALIYGQVELAADFVKLFNFKTLTQNKNINIDTITSWIHFVDTFIAIVNNTESKDMPPKFDDKYSVDTSYARFDLNKSIGLNTNILFTIVNKYLPVFASNFLKKILNFFRKSIFKSITKKIPKFFRIIEYYVGKPTKLEMLYKHVELDKIAHELKRSRFRDISFFKGTYSIFN